MALLPDRWHFSKDRQLEDFKKAVLSVINGRLDVTNVPAIATISVGSTLYIGDPNTNGSWRHVVTGNDLVTSRRENNIWVEKARTTATP